MDPIVLLLASQLLIIIAILLTTVKYKKTEASVSIKTRFASYIAVALDLQKEEESIEIDGHIMESQDLVSLKNEELVVFERENYDVATHIEHRTVIVNKTKRKKKPNSKFNGIQPKPKSTSSADISYIQTERNGVHGEVNKVFKRIFTLSFFRTILKFVVKRIFKATNETKLSLEIDSASPIASKLQHGKLIESNYLMKIISARKSEKVIRAKIARLNMVIVKARKVKPLQVIPELIEHDD